MRVHETWIWMGIPDADPIFHERAGLFMNTPYQPAPKRSIDPNAARRALYYRAWLGDSPFG
jgi:hypothetical protein